MIFCREPSHWTLRCTPLGKAHSSDVTPFCCSESANDLKCIPICSCPFKVGYVKSYYAGQDAYTHVLVTTMFNSYSHTSAISHTFHDQSLVIEYSNRPQLQTEDILQMYLFKIKMHVIWNMNWTRVNTSMIRTESWRWRIKWFLGQL